MSHHASGPNFGFPRGDARLDMIDLYAFLKPGDPAKSVIVLNVHPMAVLPAFCEFLALHNDLPKTFNREAWPPKRRASR